MNQVGRCRMHRQRGMTLVDIVVAWIVGLALVSAIATAYSVGLLGMRPSGPAGVVAGAHDQETFEQYVGQDFGRASCVMDPPTDNLYGSCGQASVFQQPGIFGKLSSKCSASAVLCIGWPTPDSSCHAAIYTLSSKLAVSRAEWIATPTSAASQVSFTDLTMGRDTATTFSSSVQVTATLTPISVTTPAGYLVSGTSYSWVSGATVTVRSAVVANPAKSYLTVRADVVDPAGPAALVSSTGTLIC